jgi:hypothetical protein
LGNTNDTYKLDVTGTGRFSAAVQINSNTTGLILNRNAVTNYNGIGYWTAGVGQWFVGMRENLSSNNYIIYNEALGTDVLTLSVSTGAATFSSSVTATTFNGTTNNIFSVSGTEGMRLTSTGLGIGTTAPEALLHINKSTAGGEGGYIYIDNAASSTLNSSVGLRFGTSSGASFSGVYTGDISNIVTNASNGASDLTFGTFNGSSSGERMRIKSSGIINLSNVPSSSAGLSSGDIYKTVAGVLMIV